MPSSDFINALDDIGAAAAAITTAVTLTILFFRFYTSQRKAEREHQAKEHEADRLLIENHLSKSISALVDTATVLQEVRDNLRELRNDVREKH